MQLISIKKTITMQLSCQFIFWVVLFSLFPSLYSLPLPLPLPLLPTNNISLYGNALFRNNGISLTQETTCLPSSSLADIGRAFYVFPIRFLDLKTGAASSFSSHFSFSIIPNPLCPFGDGIVFLITSNADSFSFSNGYMGLPNPNPQGQDSFLAVEFDTSFNPSLGDINGNHIALDVNSVVSLASIDVLSKGFDLKSGRRIRVWIEYRDSAKLIQIWVSYSQTKPPSPILVAQIDLSKDFQEYMHVGFSASNGPGSAMHMVDQWRFKTFTAYQPSMNPMDAIEQGYCFMCSPDSDPDPEDLFNSIPEDQTHNHKTSHKSKLKLKLKLGTMGVALVCLIISVAIVTAILAVVCYFMIMRKKRRVGRRRKRSQTGLLQMNNVPTRLSLAEIKSATLGFHRNRIVGEGASAVVYKGSLPSGEAVAVKRFDQSNQKEFVRNPFTTEFATMVGCLKHKHLVQLQGWCCEGSELVLVYEYLPNGSLDRLLHRNSESAIFLSWSLRLNIVLGVASALAYLHEECARQIIHRDVKTCNIMLDDEFNAKLGDFGLAEVYEHNCASREATIPAGTIGYLAPEYVYCGVPTVKTDVYSFGVVVLELATGKRPVAEDGTVLVDWVWDLWVQNKLIEAADPRLSGRYNVLEMERLLIVGLSCVHPNHEKRPMVKEAARMIRGEAPLPLLPPMRPTVMIRSNVFADSQDIFNFDGDRTPTADDSGWFSPRSHFSRA